MFTHVGYKEDELDYILLFDLPPSLLHSLTYFFSLDVLYQHNFYLLPSSNPLCTVPNHDLAG